MRYGLYSFGIRLGFGYDWLDASRYGRSKSVGVWV